MPDIRSAAKSYEPGMTCPECGALVGHWKPCSNASPELQKRWATESAASTRVLVPISGRWQVGDVVKSSTFGMWRYETLTPDGWRESTPEEKRAYEKAVESRAH